ncbi:right-handed parallel beta-helix repeat-containing protein, partial [Sinorhizobium meliloti]
EYTGPMTITENGTVIDGMIINGPLRVMADDVVIKNSEITFDSTWGVDAEGANNFTIQDSDIVGPGSSGDSNSAILGSGTFLRNDISQVENGITLTGGSSAVKGNYIHDLEDSASDPHYDGISVQGGQDGVLIEGNTILARDTSAVFIKNDFGAINDVNVTNNFLGGTPGYDIYVDGRANGGPITNVSITDNHLSMGGYGYYSVDNASPTISGNTELPAGTSPSEISGGGVGAGLAPDDATSAGITNSPASGTIEPTVESTSSSIGEEASTTSGGTTVQEVTSADELTGGSTSSEDDGISSGVPSGASTGETASNGSGSSTQQEPHVAGSTTAPDPNDTDANTWLSGVDHVVFDKLSNGANKHDAVDTGRDAAAPTWASTDKAAGAYSEEEFSTAASADDATTASDDYTAHQFDGFTHNHSFANWDFAA